MHSKLPICCVIAAKYTVNCQFFALNLSKFTPAKKNLHGHRPRVRDKYEVWVSWLSGLVYYHILTKFA